MGSVDYEDFDVAGNITLDILTIIMLILIGNNKSVNCVYSAKDTGMNERK